MKKREYDSRPRTELDATPVEPPSPESSQPAEAWQFCWKHRSWYGLTCGYCEGKLAAKAIPADTPTQLSTEPEE